jgi:hypothetical protein
LDRYGGENEGLPQVRIQVVVVYARTVDILEPVLVKLEGGNHGKMVCNIIVDVGDKCHGRSHEFRVVSVGAEDCRIFCLYARVGISEAEANLEKIGPE